MRAKPYIQYIETATEGSQAMTYYTPTDADVEEMFEHFEGLDDSADRLDAEMRDYDALADSDEWQPQYEHGNIWVDTTAF